MTTERRFTTCSPTALTEPARRRVLRAAGRACALTLCAAPPPRTRVAAGAAPRRVLIVHSFGREIAPCGAVIAAFRREPALHAPEPIVFLEAAHVRISSGFARATCTLHEHAALVRRSVQERAAMAKAA